MARQVILVNGLPGSGKSTLASTMSETLGIPTISKDAIKEALSEALQGNVPARELGVFASASIWQLAGLMEGTVILESFWLKGRDLKYVETGLRQAGARTVVEIWCDASPMISRQRYISRLRGGVHDDEGRLQDYDAWAAGADPLDVAPVIRMKTDGDVDMTRLEKTLREHITFPESR